MSFLKFINEIFRGSTLLFVFLILFIILAGALEGVGFTLFIPLIWVITSASAPLQPDGGMFGRVLNYLSFGDSLLWILVVIAVVTAGKNIFLYFEKMFAARISVDFEVDLRKRIFGTVFNAEWPFHLDQKTGALVNAMSAASNKSAMAFQVASQLSAEIVNVVLYCVVGLVISWQAFLISMVAGLFYVHFSRSFIRISRSIGVDGVDVDNDLQSSALEDFSGAKFIKGNAIEAERRKGVYDLIDRYGKVAMRREKCVAILDTFPEVIMAMIMCIIFYVSHKYFHVPGENLLVLLMVLYRFNRRTMAIQTMRQRLLNYIPSYELCAGIIEAASKRRENPEGRKFSHLVSGISLDNVGFSYGTKRVLKSVSCEIKKNQFVAFVGKSGSGKTTVVDIVVGLLKPESGSVLIDEKPISEYDILSWRNRIGYVPQNVFLINGTVEENIRLGNPGIRIEDVKEAARMAHADEFINELVRGYDTPVGDRGLRLSGGQAQRVALARALARKPELLVLDEATSALDNRSESMIQMALDELKGKLTMIVVAHRLTTIKKADVIYVLDEGGLADAGTMETLEKNSISFKKIYIAG